MGKKKTRKSGSGKKWTKDYQEDKPYSVAIHKSGKITLQKEFLYGEELHCEEKLPYPLKEVTKTSGRKSKEYIIPEEDKGQVLRQMYPFTNCPELNDYKFCLHEEKNFQVKDFKVVREEGLNYLVSPFYFKSGGLVIDWIDPVT